MEHITYLDVIDQFRYIIGVVLALFLFFHNAAGKKEHFSLRVILGMMGCGLASTGYIGLLWFYQSYGNYETYVLLAVVYWITMMFLTVGYMIFCYRISAGHAFFRGLMGFALESLVTTIIKYLIVGMLLPDLPEKYTVAYLLLAISIYAIIYGGIYHVLAKRIQVVSSMETLNNHKTAVVYALLCTVFSLISDASKGICEWIIIPMKQYENMDNNVFTIQLYSNGVMVLLSIFILLMQYYVYEIVVLQNEKKLFQHLLIERKNQYEHSRENINIINHKCHELKKQIIELEKATGPERQQMIQETKKAVMFYESVVKTNNEVLNTILTEKSLYCANKNINFTCMVNTDHLSIIEGIDLYTILENALENAITCADGFKDDDKKAIALSIYEHGKMLHISVENYYENPIRVKNGIPVSSGKEMGLQIIRTIVKKYGGDIRVTMEAPIFILQIIAPLSFVPEN